MSDLSEVSFADITGRKKIFVSGVGLFALATILLPFSPSIGIFIAIRFLQGIGVSCTVSTSVAILSSVVPKEKRGKAMGIIVACVYLGLSAGPFLAGLMIAWLGWQWIFFASVPLAMAALILTLTRLKGEWKGAEGESATGIYRHNTGPWTLHLWYGMAIHLARR